jgi:phytoene/squalene synthetase
MTRDQKIHQRLAVHYARMKELEAQGMSREDASRKAFIELCEETHDSIRRQLRAAREEIRQTMKRNATPPDDPVS